MNKSRVVLLVALSMSGVAGCGSSDEGDGAGGGFTERDRQAARQFVRLKAESPALDSLVDALYSFAENRSLAPARKTQKQLHRAAKRFRQLVPKFDDKRARSAMQDFADGSTEVASSYGKFVEFLAHPKGPSNKIYLTIRNIDAAIEDTNAADRRLSNLQAPG